MSQLTLNHPQGEERLTLFAEVIIPISVPLLFTYRVPYELNEHIAIGSRVIVPLGKSKILTGIVNSISEEAPKDMQTRMLLEVLDPEPVVNPLQLQLFHWMAEYYVCTLGEVLNVAIPSGLKLSSQSRIQLNPDFEEESLDAPLNDKEFRLVESLRNNESLTYAEAAELLEVKTLYHIIKSLISKEAILLFEEVKEKYKPKMEKRLRLTEAYAGDVDLLESLFEELEKRPKQVDLLLQYLREVPVMQQPSRNQLGIAKQELMANDLSTSSLNTLIKNGIMEEYTVKVSRFGPIEESEGKEISLNPHQEHAYQQILSSFEEQTVSLLHGITGSGKTEIYMKLIRDVLDGGGQVLYLLPEIALTTQIVKRLQTVMGMDVGVYHSRFSDNERVEVWQGVQDGTYPFVLGVRSAIFLPFDRLELIIVDEEHEHSYKAHDPAPRYQARDVATYLGHLHQAKVLMGSATPSFESYYHSQQGKYGYIPLLHRYGDAQLPQLELVDMIAERKRKTLKGEFSSVLIDAIQQALDLEEQVIIFQNRRGYAPFMQCEDCANIPTCHQCAVSLTYHMHRNELVCHYCGYKERSPSTCPSCDSTRLQLVGFGTEKLEEDLHLLFPAANIARMDLDSTRRKYSYQRLIDAFEKRETDILVGTQMVTKGLDFDHVSLVGVLDADRILHFPDFRSHERTFQLITQVSGRAGRREKPGRVIIQTKQPNHPVIGNILYNDFEGLYKTEIRERHDFHYPPFTRMIRLVVKHDDPEKAHRAAEVLCQKLKPAFGASRILGPQEPVIGKIRNLYLMELFLKLEREKINQRKARQEIKEQVRAMLSDRSWGKLFITIDVDPY